MKPVLFRVFYVRVALALMLAVAAMLFFASRGALPVLSALSEPDARNVLAPHRALYEIRLSATRSGAQVANVRGKMLYEWSQTCEGWLSNHKFNISYEYSDSPPMRILSDFSNYEPFDSRALDFASKRMRDGGDLDEFRGHAAMKAQGGGQALYKIPADLAFDLPAGTKFPAAHSLAVLKQIREGRKLMRATIFDGSDNEGPVEVTSILGSPVDAADRYKDQKNIDPGLLRAPAHKIRLAFFPLADETESSDYEMSVVFHENGVISDMTIDYDDFSVTQKLIALEPLKDGCRS